MRRALTLLFVGAGVVLAVLAFHHVTGMDSRFFGPSMLRARALAHYLAGDYGGAARLYRADLARWAAAVPKDQAWSWTLMLAGELDRAEVQAWHEARRAASDPEPLLTLSEIALARGQVPHALELAAKVLDLRRDDYDALLLTATAQARQGAHAAAIEALRRALRYEHVERRISVFLAVLEATGDLDDKPAASRPNRLLAHLHHYLGNFDASHAWPASRYAARAVQGGDRPDEAHAILGVIHARQGRRARAFAAFRQALAVNPRNTLALLGAARYHADRGELVEEYRLVRRAFDAAPDDRFVAARLYALLVDRLGDYREARAVAEAAVAADGKSADAWSRLGQVLSQLGDPRGALESYRKAAALAPRTPEIEHAIGHALAQLGRREEALAAFTKAVALNPARSAPHYGLGRLHLQSRRWADALREHEIGYALGGRDLGDVVTLCELYWETRDARRAASCATEVLARDPDNVRAQLVTEHVRAAQRAGARR